MHLDKLIELLQPTPASEVRSKSYVRTTTSVNTVTSDIRSQALGTLMKLEVGLVKTSGKNIDRMTKFHYLDCANRTMKTLNIEEAKPRNWEIARTKSCEFPPCMLLK